MNPKSIHMYRIKMELKTPFRTHAGIVKDRQLIIVEMVDDLNRSGWGEGVAFSTPFYTGETVDSSWNMLKNVFIPKLIDQKQIHHPKDIHTLLSKFKGNQMAKAALEAAAWDLYAKQKGEPLYKIIGGIRDQVEAGVVLSLEEDVEKLVPQYLREGYKRFKIKVKKGQERKELERIRKIAPEVSLMFDGNGAYEEKDIEHLKGLDDLHLSMIEQPFAAGDFYLHQKLQEISDTPICLDESIESYHDAYQAIFLKSCKVINIKISRVGGLTEAINIHHYCKEQNIPVWCGGMLESGISRAHNLALATLPQFTIPGDISSSSRYWYKDLIIPEVVVSNGQVQLSQEPGIGFQVDRNYLNEITEAKHTVEF